MADAQEPLVRIGTVLDMCGHKMPVKAITRDGVKALHQGIELDISQAAVEKAVEDAVVQET